MTYYKPGDWNVICDRCGIKTKASLCRLTWDNLFVCRGRCWEPRHPQDFVRGKEDRQQVPISRPGIVPTIGTTTLSSGASRNDLTIQVAAISQIADGDSIGILFNDGATIQWTYVDGDPAGSTVTIGTPLWQDVNSGNTVYLPAVTNESYTSPGDTDPADL